MRTTLTLDADIHQAVEQMARASGRRFGQVLSDLARRGLQSSPPQSSTNRRFPVFDVPNNAPVVTAARLQELIDADDGQ